jgi:hypothetical protein
MVRNHHRIPFKLTYNTELQGELVDLGVNGAT